VFMRTTPMLGSKATQLALGAKAIVADDNELSATAYYQDLEQLPVDAITSATPISANGGTDSGGALGISRDLVDAQFGSYSYREAIGTGHAYGLELIARRNRGTWTGWIAYTYGRSFRQNPVRGPMEYPYVLDQPHTLTLLGTTALGRNRQPVHAGRARVQGHRWRLGRRRRPAALGAPAGVRAARRALRSLVAPELGGPQPLPRHPERHVSQERRGRDVQQRLHAAELHDGTTDLSVDRRRVHSLIPSSPSPSPYLRLPSSSSSS
jgi:hypothetical protein